MTEDIKAVLAMYRKILKSEIKWLREMSDWAQDCGQTDGALEFENHANALVKIVKAADNLVGVVE